MTAPDLFSLVPLSGSEQDLPEPENGPYYVATREGYFVMQRQHWGRFLTPVKEIPTLPEQQNSWLWYNAQPQLPPEIVSQAWGFFRFVYQLQKTEAMVDITWHRKHGYRLFVPKQDVHHGGVKAERNPEHYQPGSRVVGTIHSHCNFAAYHSGTDTHDADGHDGLHMTIGHVLDDKLDIAVMLSQGGERWEKVPLEKIVINPEQITPTDFPDWWIDFVLPPAKTETKPAPPPATPQHSMIVRYIPKCVHSREINENCVPCGRYPRGATTGDTIVGKADEKYTSIDALYDDLPTADSRLVELQQLAEDLDEVRWSFEQLGIDFDYELDIAVPVNPFTSHDTPEERDLGGHFRW